jgi:hypothetical protein
LIRNFLNFSTVKIKPEQIAQIASEYPHLQPLVSAYLTRLEMPSQAPPPATDFAKVTAEFCLKAKYLKSICENASQTSGPVIEMLRMLLLQGASGLQKSNSWMYFLRFLRLTLNLGNDKNKLATYRHHTAEQMTKSIIKLYDFSYDIVNAEFAVLLASLFSAESFGEQFPNLRDFLRRPLPDVQDAWILSPSFLLLMTRYADYYPKAEVIRIVEDQRKMVFGNFLAAEELMNFFAANPSFLSKPDLYLPLVIQPELPLFSTGTQFIELVLKQAGPALKTCQDAICNIALTGYSVPTAVFLTREYYKAMIRAFSVTESAARYEVQSLQQVQDLFMAYPTLQNGIAFCDALIEMSDFFDSLNLVVEKLPPVEQCFYVAFVMLAKYYRTLSNSDKERFVSAFGSTKAALGNARIASVELIVANNLDCGFMLAAVDPTDDAVIETIRGEWEKLTETTKP